ncbi:hypothetical protein [Phaeodactylibacter sp.]|uniref:hypothetical protein n=1 Tax=Phaeodactylibacter sp. TaxID=1940289 RepID=UPI0025E92DA3|nr:hypothetical protein [Phaeodactylibacter sp.]MCI4650331.1 hypothetical protein [Phaeodactylibacter sp.]MCI5094474.1 hypothetical protein [Phaeodactylibacter sp.]
MAKEKKIGVKFFLNTRLKPKVFAGVKRYPVYSRVTFNRKNHQSPFEFENTFDGLMSEVEFEKYIVEKSNPKIISEIEQYEKEVKGIVRIWHKKFGDDFSLLGLSETHKEYKVTPLLFRVSFQVREGIRDYVIDHRPDKFRDVFYAEDVFPTTPYFALSSFFKYDEKTSFSDWPLILQYSVFSFVLLSSYLKMGFWFKDEHEAFDSKVKIIDWVCGETKIDFINYLTHKKYLKEDLQLSSDDPFAKGPIQVINLLKKTTIDIKMVTNIIDASLFP